MARKLVKFPRNQAMAATGDTTAGRSARWSPARIFLLIVAVAYVPLGIGGLVVDRSFPIGAAAAERAGSGLAFGIFETNGWHAMASLVIAVIAVYFIVN
ncbi:MAG: hypothetical protein M3135_00200, partial [Actinomycetota bacterium]|nr:hypothetical protein [Actinomycetota bacterium]